jgi:hypothetical protein
MIGRRVGSIAEIEKPGDYCGPIEGYTGDKPALFFIPPNVTPESLGTWPHGRLHHITFPPHTFRECPDGSVEVRASIGCHGGPDQGYSWHGYLDEGHVWRDA